MKLNEKIKYRVIVIFFAKKSKPGFVDDRDRRSLSAFLAKLVTIQVVHEFLNTSTKVGGLLGQPRSQGLSLSISKGKALGTRLLLGVPKWAGQCYQNSGPVHGPLVFVVSKKIDNCVTRRLS